MLYTTELLDRSTGNLRIVDLGNWITLTELGQQYGLGPKKIRSALYHLGMLQTGGKRLRLTPRAVALGYGRRHDFPKRHRYPFDVISPLGQKTIAENWEWLIADLAEEKQSKLLLQVASEALEGFRKSRSSGITSQMEVCWLRDHFPVLTQDEIASLIDISRPLVNRYGKLQEKQRGYAWRQSRGELQGVTIAAATMALS